MLPVSRYFIYLFDSTIQPMNFFKVKFNFEMF